MTALLKWLTTSPKCSVLPMDARTLFKTPRFISDIENMGGASGKFYNFGIVEGLTRIFLNHNLNFITTIELYVNIDGVPLHKSSKK